MAHGLQAGTSATEGANAARFGDAMATFQVIPGLSMVRIHISESLRKVFGKDDDRKASASRADDRSSGKSGPRREVDCRGGSRITL